VLVIWEDVDLIIAIKSSMNKMMTLPAQLSITWLIKGVG
jgi:hypothetical protein